MSYLYDPNDGKIHTRYSELMVCTPGQIWRVLKHRNEEDGLNTPSINHGRLRHELWAEESLGTGLLPATFERPGRALMVEAELVGEILPGVVLHGRIDALTDDFHTVVDYKTMTAKDANSGALRAHDRYRNSKQLKLYAYLLRLNGYRITKAVYMVELWNDAYDTILGYVYVEQAIDFGVIGPALSWAEDRVSLLVGAFNDQKNVAE